MSYRHTDFVERCVECDAPTGAQCARCMKLLCAAHLFTADQTCLECESEWLGRTPKARPLRKAAVLGALGMMTGAAIIFLAPLAVYAIFAVGTLGFASFIRRDYQVLDRSEFLAERRRLRPAARGLLPVASGGPDARAEERQGSEG